MDTLPTIQLQQEEKQPPSVMRGVVETIGLTVILFLIAVLIT